MNYEKPTSNKILDRMKMNPLLTWLSDMVSVAGKDEIKVPKDYRSMVLEVKNLLDSDTSGYVNTVLDFAVNSGLVKYKIEAKNKNLTKLLNTWLENLNDGLRGQIPVGVQALAKEYFRERWKGSSFLLLRTFWEKKDGLYLPTVLYFVDGEDIIVESKSKTKDLNGRKYSLRVSKEESQPIGRGKDEKLFIQKPFTPWGMDYSVPYVIQRGLFRNLKFLQLLEKKGEFVVGKALEYLAILRKGTEKLTLSNNPDFIYDGDDLAKIKKDFSKFLSDRKVMGGSSVYATGFDTELEHSIPEYSRALKQELYTPIERRIIAGLGLLEVVSGISSTRKESFLNPRPFFTEIDSGIADFKSMLLDIMVTIADENKSLHRKYFRKDIKIQTPLINSSLDFKMLTQLRSGYDRGIVSKRTYCEVLGIDFEVELGRRKDEVPFEEDLFPPVIQNQERFSYLEDFPKNKNIPGDKKVNDKKEDKPIKDNIPDDKKGIEKKNFDKAVNYEQAPYTKKSYPSQLKSLPVGARNIWIDVFNQSFPKGEDYARKVAWSVVKEKYFKDKDEWKKKK